MSIRAMQAVWDYSVSEHGGRLVMLAIADNADEVTFEAWPSLTTLEDKTKLGASTIRLWVDRLVDLKELAVQWGAGPHGRHKYKLLLPGALGAVGSSKPKRRTPQKRHPAETAAPNSCAPQDLAPDPAETAGLTPQFLAGHIEEPSVNRPEPSGDNTPAPDGGAVPSGTDLPAPANGSEPQSAPSAPSAAGVGAGAGAVPERVDRWLGLKRLVAHDITGDPEAWRQVQRPTEALKYARDIVILAGRLANHEPDDAEEIWAKFVEGLTPAQRTDRLTRKSAVDWLGRWAIGAGASWIRSYLELAARKREQDAHNLSLWRNTCETLGEDVARQSFEDRGIPIPREAA